jgi:putative restriction endonuclease
MTVDPNKKTIVVSPRIREEYENGRDYYALHGRPLAQSQNRLAVPSLENLTYHAEHVFRA